MSLKKRQQPYQKPRPRDSQLHCHCKPRQNSESGLKGFDIYQKI